MSKISSFKINLLSEFVTRHRADKSIRAAANEIGISKTTLCKIEGGHIPDIKTLDKVIAWMGVELWCKYRMVK